MLDKIMFNIWGAFYYEKTHISAYRILGIIRYGNNNFGKGNSAIKLQFKFYGHRLL